MDQLAPDVACFWGHQLRDLVAVHAIPFTGLQLAMGPGFLLCLDPGGEIYAINPQMITAIPLMWSTCLQPISQSAIRNAQFLRNFPQGVEHGQQARGSDNDQVGQFDTNNFFHPTFLQSGGSVFDDVESYSRG